MDEEERDLTPAELQRITDIHKETFFSAATVVGDCMFCGCAVTPSYIDFHMAKCHRGEMME